MIWIRDGISPTGQFLLSFAYDALGRRVETTEDIDPQTGASSAMSRAS